MRVLLKRSVFWPSRHSQNVLALRPEPFTFFPSPQSPPFENRSFFTRLGPDALCNPSVINHTYSCGGVDIGLEKQNSRDRGCEEDPPFVLSIYIRPASGSEREKVNPRPAIPAILLLSTNAFFLKRVSALQHTRAGGMHDVPVALDVDDQRGGVRSSGFSMLTPTGQGGTNKRLSPNRRLMRLSRWTAKAMDVFPIPPGQMRAKGVRFCARSTNSINSSRPNKDVHGSGSGY